MFALIRQRHRAALILQRNMKSKIVREKFVSLRDASVIIQSGNKLS